MQMGLNKMYHVQVVLLPMSLLQRQLDIQISQTRKHEFIQSFRNDLFYLFYLFSVESLWFICSP